MCFSFNPKHLNLSLTATQWNSAGATWYGSPDGFGSDGGSCGYGDVVSQPSILFHGYCSRALLYTNPAPNVELAIRSNVPNTNLVPANQ
ncbi:hypothetical protein M0R45_037796 [Rubus argutus]|uniref:Uncharacterized protein n=1 Tax=Rubus argutus TaxID=59490 RepID=A0AAW1W134_RUBAR